MRKIARWFRNPKEQTAAAERQFREASVAQAERRLKELLESENAETLEAVRRLRDLGLV